MLPAALMLPPPTGLPGILVLNLPFSLFLFFFFPLQILTFVRFSPGFVFMLPGLYLPG